MNARLTLAAATLALMAAGLLRREAYFSADGTKLVFASSRNQKTRGDTSIFMAGWKR